MNLGICVITWTRPNYLYVALDSLFKMRGIENYPVYVFCDGMDDKSIQGKLYNDITQVVSQFPCASVNFSQKHLGLGKMQLWAVGSTIDKHDYALYVEDDIILRPDSLEYLERVTKETDGHFYSLYRAICDPDGSLEFGGYTALGVTYTKPAWDIISRVIKTKEYLGMRWPRPEPMLLGECQGVFEEHTDGVFHAISQKYNMLRVLPDKNYGAYFGLVNSALIQYTDQGYGMVRDPEYAELVKEHESVIYSKPKDKWLPTILELLRKGNYPEELDFKFFPRHFEYTD